MTTPEKIQFYRRVLLQMEGDFEKWEYTQAGAKCRCLKGTLEDVECDFNDGLITDPHPRQLPGGRIAKRWEWWLHTWFPKLFTLEE
jgi:hypothetical protein